MSASVSAVSLSASPLVIVGSGMAGNQLLKQFRKLNSEREVIVICADSGDFYSKPMLSNAIKQNKTPVQLRMQSAEHLSQTLQARYQTHTKVLQIDRANQQLITSAGIQPYGQCVLAVGAQPRRLSWLGNAADEQVHAINDWQAYAQFRAQLDLLLQHKKVGDIRIAIIGAGLVGCEFANDLRTLGVQVLLFSPQAECLFPVFPAQAGVILRNALQQNGIECVMPSTVTDVDQVDGQLCIRGEGFEEKHVDLVITAIGLIAQNELAVAAGLHTDNGICVNAHLKASDDAIFALGDCVQINGAQVNGQSLRYILPIMHSAAALAQTLNGTPTAVKFPLMPILLKTPVCPMLIAAATSGQAGEWQWQGSGCDWMGLCHGGNGHGGNGQMINFVLSGQCLSEKSALLKQLAVSG